jgi:hypothetical protein
MKNLTLTILSLLSLTATAQETIKNPKFDGAKFTCSSELDAVCNALGFEYYVSGSVKCKNYKLLGFLSIYESYQDHAFAPGKTNLISAEINTYYNATPTIIDGVKDKIRAYNSSYVFYNAIGSANSKVIRKITCAGQLK